MEVFDGVDSAVGVEKLHHLLGHWAVVEGVAAMRGDLTERVREGGVLEEVAGLGGVGPDDIGLFVAGLIEKPFRNPVTCIALGERESILRIVDGGCEQCVEWQSAEAAVQGVPPGNRSRDIDGLDADRVDLGHAFGLEVIDGQRLRRPAAGVQAIEFAGLCLVVDGKEVSADTVDVGLDDAHDGVGRDGRVNGVAAFFENVGASLRGEKLRG